MNPLLKNIIAICAGIILGSVVNMALVNAGYSFIPLPNETKNLALNEAVLLFQPKHFLFPFLAHAVGTLVGAFITAYIAFNHQLKFALAIGCLFLFGGISMILALKAPMWFNVTDAILAYIPMALLGYFLAAKLKLRH
jgi:hypothetical protein